MKKSERKSDVLVGVGIGVGIASLAATIVGIILAAGDEEGFATGELATLTLYALLVWSLVVFCVFIGSLWAIRRFSALKSEAVDVHETCLSVHETCLSVQETCQGNVAKIKGFITLYDLASDLIHNIVRHGRRIDPKDSPVEYARCLRGEEEAEQILVVSSDLFVDLTCEAVYASVRKNLKEKPEKYRYIVPKDKTLDRYHDGRDEKSGLALLDCYWERFKEVLPRKGSAEGSALRERLFLEIDPALFSIFGPLPERSLYQEGNKTTLMLFEKRDSSPHDAPQQKGLDPPIILLESQSPGELANYLMEFGESFRRLWDKLKNIDYSEPTLQLSSVDVRLERPATTVKVLTRNLAVDLNYDPIRACVEEHINKLKMNGGKPKYQYIVPYRKDTASVLEEYLNSFKLTAKHSDLLNEMFRIVEGDVFGRFENLGETALYEIPRTDGLTVSSKSRFVPRGDSLSGVVVFPPVSMGSKDFPNEVFVCDTKYEEKFRDDFDYVWDRRWKLSGTDGAKRDIVEYTIKFPDSPGSETRIELVPDRDLEES